MSGKCESRIDMSGDFLLRVHNAVKAGFRDCLKLQIIPEAKANSPKRTGVNADTIEGYIGGSMARAMVKGSINTQSGHGGYLEKGTSKMDATPYIYPAVERGMADVGTFIQVRLEEFAQGQVQNIPNEVIGRAVAKLRKKPAKGVGVVGGAGARKYGATENRKRWDAYANGKKR